MSVHYDALDINRDILLDLPFREGIGAITHSVAKTHPAVKLINTPTWTPITSGLGVLEFNGTTEYLEADNADTLNLRFIGDDYSIGCWLYWASGGGDVQHLMGRYDVDVAFSGWELYLYSPTPSLNLRHHHAGTLVGVHPRSGVDSVGWTFNEWQFVGVSRSGDTGTFYRNAVDVTLTGTGLVDPETCAEDLTIGVRFTKASEYLKGKLWRPRIWGRALTQAEWAQIYERELRWFA